MNITGKVAIVTGASSGIGLATAKLLSQKGAKVAFVARSKKKLVSLAKELKNSFVIVTDIRKENEVRTMIKKVVKHFGRIDILINNAGRGYDASIENIEIKKYRELMDLDLIGPLIAMQQVIPIMRQQKKGVIINISSGTALMAIPNISAYSSIKRALVGISLTAKEELKNDGIIVCVVYPFITETNFHKNVMGGERKVLPSEDNHYLPKADSAEYIAEKIVIGIENGSSEIFAHEWMKNKD